MEKIREAAPAMGTDTIKAQEDALSRNTKPTAFRLRAQMLEQGRTDTVVAASDDLVMRLKVYASGGENTLHAHTSEDHAFVILQGSGRFFGPEGETLDLGQWEGLMIPKGNYYKFFATSEVPLVLLRVASPSPSRQTKPYRIDIDGNELRGDSKKNNTVPVVFKEGEFFGADA